ncbi:MAG: methylphosphotriester-DNA--protein-cysteine methyltransferase family protein [candidate division Zixibacteria bacterium]|nr:methylphosphotriester-DNA--protein-cysteine methyltransferase family protein [candidate division Zixibacteria bacterium]
MKALTRKEMVRAFTGNDSSYDGKYYVGVRSTGIYCLPSCKAKLPKLENVVFYTSREEAIAAGLRGCLRCKSERYPDVLPRWLPKVLEYMRTNRDVRLTEAKLIRMTRVDISTVRRYFKDQLGMTPLAFHRRQRLNYARELIDSGNDYLKAAYECGYESASGFRDAFRSQFGYPPGRLYAKRPHTIS